jgi:hypothetical protein
MNNRLHLVGNIFEIICIGSPAHLERSWGEYDSFLKTFNWWEGSGILTCHSTGEVFTFTFETHHTDGSYDLYESVVFLPGYGAYGRGEQEILDPLRGADHIGEQLITLIKEKGDEQAPHLRLQRLEYVKLVEGGVIADSDGQVCLPLGI